MLKIFFPNESKMSIGGGWTFLGNIQDYFNKNNETLIVGDAADADVIFIMSASILKGDQLDVWKKQGKKILLRVDNIPKDSRNRGTGVSRLRKCAEMADMIIYQSQWAKEYAGQVTRKDGKVIYNGCDQNIFSLPDVNKPKEITRYLFVHYNRDENKRFPEAAYYFMKRFKENNSCRLMIIGQFSPELTQYNFDFFNGESIDFIGVIDKKEHMAELMKKNDVLLFPAFADASPQTVVEAISCGLQIELVNDVGGTRELLHFPREFFTVDRMGEEYLKAIKSIL